MYCFIHLYLLKSVFRCVSVVSQTGHVARAALLSGGVNKKASGVAAGWYEKWSNLLLSWNQWHKLRCWAPPAHLPQLLPLVCSLNIALPLSLSVFLNSFCRTHAEWDGSCLKTLLRIYSLSDLPDFSLVSFSCFDLICFGIFTLAFFILHVAVKKCVIPLL